MISQRDFTPALGFRMLTPLYDTVIAIFTREQAWRSKLVELIALSPGERLLDVGCGTGSLAIALSKRTPGAEIVGLDPDMEVLGRAAAKIQKAKVYVELRQGFLTGEFLNQSGRYDVMCSSLVFHQVPLEKKSDILELMNSGLKPGGRICIADYGLQRSWLMRRLFRATVQNFDGVDDTQPNADGKLPELMTRAGFQDVRERLVVATPTGSISLYQAVRS